MFAGITHDEKVADGEEDDILLGDRDRSVGNERGLSVGVLHIGVVEVRIEEDVGV